MRNDARSRYRTAMAGAAQALREKRRREVVAMVESCGLRPKDVPLYTEICRDGPRILLERFVRDEKSGNILMDETLRTPRIEQVCIEPDRVPSWIPYC